MHTFGFPGRASEIRAICDEWGLILIDDAAEALGSYDEHGHVGIQAHVATLSFNGNKVVTTGGGGAILRILTTLRLSLGIFPLLPKLQAKGTSITTWLGIISGYPPSMLR